VRVTLPKLVALFWLLALAETLRADPLDHWNVRASDTGRNLYGVTHGLGRFVIVGQWGTILISSNGVHWNATATNLTQTLYSVTFGANWFVAVGEQGTVLTSSNGVEWASQNPTTNGLKVVRWLGDRFLAAGEKGTLLSSVDGQSWVPRDSGTVNTLNGVAFGNGQFVAVGGGNTQLSSITHSSDGLTWSNEYEDRNYLYDATFGNGRFVVLSVRGRIYVSTNALNWTELFRTVNSDYLFGITHAYGLFVGVGGPYNGGSQKIVTSSDGLNWQWRAVTTGLSPSLRAVAHGNRSFVAVGDKGIILQSDPILRLAVGRVLSGGAREWLLNGEIGRNYRFQFALNPVGGEWTDITSFTASDETTLLTDPTAGDAPFRFYRVVSP
jgi:hypothetical protein